MGRRRRDGKHYPQKKLIQDSGGNGENGCSSKINEPIKKCATELNRAFSKEKEQMAKKHLN
jgi:hypothetical protein